MSDPTPDIQPEDLTSPLQAYRRGDAGDLDDVVQESLLAALGYLEQDREFAGDFPHLAITIARNRCRDLLRHRRRFPHRDIAPLAEWIVDPQASPLDHLENNERRDLLQRALTALSDACRKLLQAMYIDEIDTDVIRRRLGLNTVQAVYYRRTVCVDQMVVFLQGLRPGRSGDVRVGDSAERPDRRAE